MPADIVFNDSKSVKCQAAALIFSANNKISHYPSSSWLDYSLSGADAASNSNIGWGSSSEDGGSLNYGPGAVDGYMVDDGANNTEVGHRRWLLYSLANEMGTGDVPQKGSNGAGNAIWVIGNFKASTSPQFVAWPNSGYVVRDLVPLRWSLSYPGASFSSASVTMRQNGTNVPTTVISRTNNGSGDNSLVWEPSSLAAPSTNDVSYYVTVSGIGGSGVQPSYSYTVKAFNPGILGQSVGISGTATPSTFGATYTFNSIPQSDAYQLSVSTGSIASWNEGGENTNNIIDGTIGGYSPIQSSVVRSGTSAFHLTFDSFNDQEITLARKIIPTASSTLTFYNLFRFVTLTSRLSAEVSTDKVARGSRSGDSMVTEKNIVLGGINHSVRLMLAYHILPDNAST
jgi:hypothetical protein